MWEAGGGGTGCKAGGERDGVGSRDRRPGREGERRERQIGRERWGRAGRGGKTEKWD